MIYTGDTGLILVIPNTSKFSQDTQVWLAPGSIADHEIAEFLFEEKPKALALFPAFTGSAVTSFFAHSLPRMTFMRSLV